MSFSPVSFGSRFDTTRQALDAADGHPLREALPTELLEAAAGAEGLDLQDNAATIYTPTLTLCYGSTGLTWSSVYTT